MKKNEKKVENSVLYDRIVIASKNKGYSSVSAMAIDVLGNSGNSAANRWKSGSSIISGHLLKLSKSLGVSIDYLLGNDEYAPTALSEQEAEMLAVYRRLDMRSRILLHARAYELEESGNNINKSMGEKDTTMLSVG